MSGQIQLNQEHVSCIDSIRKWFMNYYPIIYATMKAFSFVFQLRYVIGKSKYYNPSLAIMGQEIQFLSKKLREKGRKLNFLSFLIGPFIFYNLLFFVAWCYDNRSGIQTLHIPIPPPPPKHKNKVSLPSDKKICPLCKKKRTNPACIPSGYVFCLVCIEKKLSVIPQCPITFRPTKIDEIRKIFE